MDIFICILFLILYLIPFLILNVGMFLGLIRGKEGIEELLVVGLMSVLPILNLCFLLDLLRKNDGCSLRFKSHFECLKLNGFLNLSEEERKQIETIKKITKESIAELKEQERKEIEQIKRLAKKKRILETIELTDEDIEFIKRRGQ